MIATAQSRRQAHGLLAAALCCLGMLALVLRVWPPGTSGIYPVCAFHEYTGLLCPGCGTTRALAALLRGDLSGAMHWNALTTLLLPLAVVYAAVAYGRVLRGKPAWIDLPRAAWVGLALVAAGFAVGRNLS